MKTSMTFNILIKREKEYFLAHCLELDIVTTAEGLDEVRDDILSLIKTQIEYAFNNENLDNLYHSAPQKVWDEFYSCTEGERGEAKIEVYKSEKGSQKKIPLGVIANTCLPDSNHCYA